MLEAKRAVKLQLLSYPVQWIQTRGSQCSDLCMDISRHSTMSDLPTATFKWTSVIEQRSSKRQQPGLIRETERLS
eukprot:scaffold203281_cov17-Prasinocladus_malaysianus.AAC.1